MKHKVLFILHYPPPLNGGASFMGKVIKESKIINGAFNADFINLTTSFNLSKVSKGEFPKLLTTLKILIRVIKALHNNEYDLCYMTLTATGLGFYKDLLIVSALKLYRKKILYHFHNKGVASASKNIINHSLYRYAFRYAKCILISRRLYADIEKYVEPKDVYYCANGIPAYTHHHLQTQHVAKVLSPTCRLLFFSNMMLEKGVNVLLQACTLLRDRNILFKCSFVGEWVDIKKEDFYEYVSKNDLNNHVFAYGPKFNQDKTYYFENADIFVFPTFFHNETFGLVNLEAMQHALPIVSTPEGGIPDVVLDGITGLLVPQKNAIALADSLEILIKDPDLRERMGMAGKERFHKFFTVDIFEENLTELLIKNTLRETELSFKTY